MKSRQGFTLIEVALAVLAVGLGLMAIFALFPAGLQNAEDDATDTQAGLFADAVFSAIRGNAATITNASDWANNFIPLVSAVIPAGVPSITFDGQVHGVPFNGGNAPIPYLRYRAQITNGISSRIYSATLQVCPGQDGLYTTQNVFYTEFVYMGM